MILLNFICEINLRLRLMEAHRWFLTIKWFLIAKDKFFTFLVAGLLTMIGTPTSMPDFMHTTSKWLGGSCSSELRPFYLSNYTNEKIDRQIMDCTRCHNAMAIQWSSTTIQTSFSSSEDKEKKSIYRTCTLITSIQIWCQNFSPILRRREDQMLATSQRQSLTRISKKSTCKDIQ